MINSFVDSLSKYIPEFEESTVAVKSTDGSFTVEKAKRQIILRDLLTHTAGIDYGYGLASEEWEEGGMQGWYFAHRNEPILETVKRIDSDKIYSPCKAGGRFVEVLPDGIVRGCEVEKLWDVSNIGSVNNTNLDIVDIVKSAKAKEFQKIAKNCTCTFECANAINTVYDPKHWPSLLLK